MTNEEYYRIRAAQDDSWEAGYFAGRDGEPYVVPAGVSWPSQWRIGWRAAVEDKNRNSKAAHDAEATR